MIKPGDLAGPQQATNRDEFSGGCAWVSGRYLPIDQAGMPLTDAGITRSDLTYDVVAVWDGRFFRLDDHIDRLLRGCERIRLTPPLPREQIRDVLIECVRRSGLRESYVEAIVTRGLAPRGVRDPRQYQTQFYAYAIPYVWISEPGQQTVGADLVVARDTIRIPTRSVDPTVKNFHWGDLTRGIFESIDRGAMTAVLPDGDGNVTEGPGFNIFAVLDGTLSTPSRGVLEGITRRTALEIAQEFGIPTCVTEIPVDALCRATEIFLTSTAGGIMPVRTLDGHPVGDGRPGEITTRIRDQYWALHNDHRYTTTIDYPEPGRPFDRVRPSPPMETGSGAFDFIYGHWRVHNRKLRDVTDPNCEEWVEFEATSEAFPILDGIGHIDRIYVPDPPDGAPFEGFTLRLFDPGADTWTIWWSSTRAPGRLDPPLTGRFENGQGIFTTEDVLGGRPVNLRFEWTADPDLPVWRQLFSFDRGASWSLNWVMTLTRETG